MISESGRSNRAERASSSSSCTAKWRALKRPVFGSTRASACRAGTLSERCTTRSGPSASGISQGFVVQNAATTTPIAVRTRSVVIQTVVKSPDSRKL